MNTKSKLTLTNILLILIAVLFTTYLFSIQWINFNSRAWYNFDLYADSMIARYIAEDFSIFPDQWVFGNQFYVVATPVLAAVIYSIVGSTTLALSLASFLMTFLVLFSFVWCLKPYVSKRSILVGLLCLIGGTLYNTNAATSEEGLQVFYTMGSYYSCYIIGIFFTLGIWMRLKNQQQVSPVLMVLCFLMNFALGMQSLREMLVLILPWGVLICLLIVVEWLKRKANGFHLFTKDRLFALAMFFASAAGFVLTKVLIKTLPIPQHTILHNVRGSLAENAQDSIQALLNYTGISGSNGLPAVIVAAFCFLIVGYAAVSVLLSRKISPMFCLLGFCVISIGGVFASGIVKIYNRQIYYFVWYILVAFSFVYAFDRLENRKHLRNAILAVLIVISAYNGYHHFHTPMEDYQKQDAFYQEVVDVLKDDGITTLFYDEVFFHEAPAIGACSDDSILCAGFFMYPEEQNFMTYIGYLCNTEWFYPDDLSKTYLVMSDSRLDYLSNNTSAEYREALFSHLILKHQFSYEDKTYYFYTLDAYLYNDMMH